MIPIYLLLSWTQRGALYLFVPLDLGILQGWQKLYAHQHSEKVMYNDKADLANFLVRVLRNLEFIILMSEIILPFSV